MKKLLTGVVLLLVVLTFSNCSKYYDAESQIVGVWTWTYAYAYNGENLMDVYDYNTATFNDDGTYNFDIGNYSHDGTYTVDSENNTITFDGTDTWDILEISKKSLQIKGQSDTWYEWHFEK